MIFSVENSSLGMALAVRVGWASVKGWSASTVIVRPVRVKVIFYGVG